MAAPTIRGSVIPSIVTNGDVSITSPSSTAVGDLCIFFLWTQGGDSTTITHTVKVTFFSWFQHAHEDGTTDGRLSVCVKKATGAGAVSYTPFNVANGTASQSSLGMIVLTAGTYSANLDTVIPQMGTSATSTNNTAPDCPVVPASGSLTGDFLILAVAAWHVTTAGSTQGTAGANYTVEIQNANASHVTHLAVKRRALTGLSAATENPPGWTDNVTPNGTAVQTVAVRALVEHTTSIATDGGSALDVSAPTVEVPAGAIAIDGGGAFAVADTTVTGGFTEHFKSAAIDGGSRLTVAAPALATTTTTATDGGSVLTIATPVKATTTTIATDGGSALVISAPVKATTTSAAVDGISALTVAAPNKGTTTAAAIDGGPALQVDASASGPAPVAHTASCDLSGGSAVAIGNATRETFTRPATDGPGAIAISGPLLATFTAWACGGNGGLAVVAAVEYTTSAEWAGAGGFVIGAVDKSRPTPHARNHQRTFSPFTRSRSFPRLRRRR